MGLQMNVMKKTSVLIFERKANRTDFKIVVDIVELEQVDQFLYLGWAFNGDGQYRDVIKRMSARKKVNEALGRLLNAQF